MHIYLSLSLGHLKEVDFAVLQKWKRVGSLEGMLFHLYFRRISCSKRIISLRFQIIDRWSKVKQSESTTVLMMLFQLPFTKVINLTIDHKVTFSITIVAANTCQKRQLLNKDYLCIFHCLSYLPQLVIQSSYFFLFSLKSLVVFFSHPMQYSTCSTC